MTETETAKASEAAASSPAPVAGLEAEIVRQVEHYFGDYNLPKDKFLQEQIKEDEGWVSKNSLDRIDIKY